MSLRFRLTAYSTILLVFVMVLVIVLVEFRTRRLLFDGARGQAVSVAQSLAATMTDTLVQHNDVELQRKATRAVQSDPRISEVAILEKGGRVAACGGCPEGESDESLRITSEEAGTRQVLVREIHTRHDHDRGRALDVIHPLTIPQSRERWGTLILRWSLEEVYSELRTTRLILSAIGVVGILTGFIISGLLAGRVARPVLDLAKAAEEVAKGYLDRRIRVDRRDEIGLLAETYNRMADELAASRRRDAAWQKELEQRVEERTGELIEKGRQVEASCAEARLAREKINYLMEYHRNILDSVNEGIFAVDRNLVVQSWSKAMERHLGLSRADAMGKPLGELLPESDREAWLARYTAVFDHAAQFLDLEQPVTSRDGRTSTYSIETLPLRNETGAVIGATTLMRDIAEYKARAQQIMNVERMRALGEMASGVAHNFNNILGVILGRVELIRAVTADPALLSDLDIIEKVTLDGAATVRRIQDYTRIRTEQEFEPVDVGLVLAESLGTTRWRWAEEAEKLGLRYSIVNDAAEGLYVRGDSVELRDVIANMIINALDAMPGGGELRISAREQNGFVIIQVADTGIGMSDDVKARLFDPFFSTKGTQGTGLGLAVAYGVMKRHDGRITVDSAPGCGTVFTIVLPSSRAAVPEERPVEPAVVAELPQKKQARILVVDDDEFIRDLLTEILEMNGHMTCAVDNGEEGLEVFSREGFDVVITDLGMAEMNGYEFVRRLRGMGSNVPVVLSTGWGEQINEEELRARGIDAVITKPFQIGTLLDTVGSSLSRPPARA